MSAFLRFSVLGVNFVIQLEYASRCFVVCQRVKDQQVKVECKFLLRISNVNKRWDTVVIPGRFVDSEFEVFKFEIFSRQHQTAVENSRNVHGTSLPRTTLPAQNRKPRRKIGGKIHYFASSQRSTGSCHDGIYRKVYALTKKKKKMKKVFVQKPNVIIIISTSRRRPSERKINTL